MKRRLFLAFGGAWAASTQIAFGANADASLYDAAPPPDSAFVRVVNAKMDGSSLNSIVGATQYGALAVGGASPYRPLKAGKAALKLGKTPPTFSFAAGGFYSIVVKGAVGAETASLLTDPALATRVQSLLIFYNCTAKPALDLKTTGGAASVFSGVASGKIASRLVNPAKSGFQVVSGEKAVANLGEQSIERGAAYSIIATEANGKVTVAWVRSETRNK